MVAPVLDWDDETADNSPDFTVDFDEGDVVEGNDVTIEVYSNAGLTLLVETVTHAITAAEILAGAINMGGSALADGTYYVRSRVESGSWSNTEIVTITGGGGGIGPDGVPISSPPDTASPGGGSSFVWFANTSPEDEWRKRRKKLKELEGIIARAAGEVPSDVPEARVIKAAAAKIDAAVDVLSEAPSAPVLPPIDLRALRAAAASAEKALEAYKARRQAELAEEDDEDILLLLD